MVFVTGATGLLGSHLAYFLIRSGHFVRALRRPQSSTEAAYAVFCQYPDGEQLWQQLEWVEGDVLDKDSMAAYVRRSAYVYHCAAVVSFSGSDHSGLIGTNLHGTENISSLCLEYKKRLCYVSSIAALGDAARTGEIIDESTPEIPGREHAVYSQSKRKAEEIVWKYISSGLDAVIVCPSIILGAGLWTRSSAQLYLAAARGIPFYTKGISGYVDVRDVAELMIRLAEDSFVTGERFILNAGNYSFQELFTCIARANGKHPPDWYVRPWMTELIWRMLAVTGKVTGKKPAFTRETARSAHHCSLYSSNKILSLYPDFHFYPLTETIEHIRLMWIAEKEGAEKGKRNPLF